MMFIRSEVFKPSLHVFVDVPFHQMEWFQSHCLVLSKYPEIFEKQNAAQVSKTKLMEVNGEDKKKVLL